MLPWQRRFVRSAFTAGVQSAALSVARGNGKTSLLSAIACATLDGPLMVPRGETVIVASSFEQARIAFEHVHRLHGRQARMTSAGGRFGTRRNKRGSRTARRARGCAASAPILVALMGWRPCSF